MKTSQEALLAALNKLIVDEDARHLYDSLTACIAVKIAHPVALTGDAAVLNPLIEVGRSDPDRFQWLIQRVDEKRREALKAPLVQPKDDGFDKSGYMREFMYQKRNRMRRAAEIENLQRPARDRLVGRDRLDFMDAQAAKWKAELDRRVEAARVAQGGRLPKEVLETLRRQFWESVDVQLDEADRKARLPK